jgi:hypothetical protein
MYQGIGRFGGSEIRVRTGAEKGGCALVGDLGFGKWEMGNGNGKVVPDCEYSFHFDAHSPTRACPLESDDIEHVRQERCQHAQHSWNAQYGSALHLHVLHRRLATHVHVRRQRHVHPLSDPTPADRGELVRTQIYTYGEK